MNDRASAPATAATTEGVLIRFDPNHLKIVSEAADYLGLPRSAWIRGVAIREARGVLAEKAEDPLETRARKSA
jgi:uncharacterized protein (DUF1778 family)